ncbi:hypothetical protein Zmor_027726 [Zophobas morio]|uniref:Reverse transcriptase domain-containing protein n=1 Tax=Zophobas morio TaxID=2755281 RepID=A0AA38M2T2_9CUCU|nr:hypothetical protein Zmor_027726 [Zophobas morio]
MGLQLNNSIRSHQCLADPDDLVLLARNRKELEMITAKLIRQAEEVVLEFNIEKTKDVELKNNCGSRNKNNLQIDRQEGIKVEFEELEIWERKILRRIFGGKQTEGGWERGTNGEIYDLYNDTVVSNFIKIKRLQ